MRHCGHGLGLICFGLGLTENFWPRPRPRPHTFWPRPRPRPHPSLASITIKPAPKDGPVYERLHCVQRVLG